MNQRHASVRGLVAAFVLGVLAACGGGGDAPPPPALAITVQPQPVAVSEVSTATFAVAATGAPPLAYQWYRNGVAIAGATTASYTTPRTTLADHGARFSVVVANAAARAQSNEATLTVYAKRWQPAAQLAGGVNNDGPARVIADAGGNAIALYVTANAGRFDLVAQRLARGVWAAARTVQVDGSNAPAPQLGYDGAGNAVTVWQAGDGARLRIWSSRYQAATDVWSAPLAISSAGVDAAEPQLSVVADGGALAVWRQFDGVFYSIAAARFNAASGTWSAAEWIETQQRGDAVAPQIARDVAGNALAVWRAGAGTRRDVWVNRYDATAGAWGAAALLETDDASNADEPQLGIDAAGNAIALWIQRAGSRNSVWARRFAAASGTWDAAQPIESEDAGDAQRPRVVIDGAGHATAVWEQFDGARWNVFANRFDAASGTWGTAVALENDDRGAAREPEAAVDPVGNVVAVWRQFDGTRDSIWSARYDAAARAWSAAVALEATDAEDAEAPQLAIDGNGDVSALWFQFDATGAVNLWVGALK